jgi:hypothetical protein
MKKTFRKQQEETQKVWKNVPHDGQFNPWNNYYSVIKIGDKSYLTEYESKFRSEAVAVFQEEARLSGGFVETVGVYKK